MLPLNGSMARTRSELTMSNYVIQSPDPLLSQPFPDSINPDENTSILSIERRKYIEKWKHIEFEEKDGEEGRGRNGNNESERNHLSTDEFHLPKEIIRKNSSICIPAAD